MSLQCCPHVAMQQSSWFMFMRCMVRMCSCLLLLELCQEQWSMLWCLCDWGRGGECFSILGCCCIILLLLLLAERGKRGVRRKRGGGMRTESGERNKHKMLLVWA